MTPIARARGRSAVALQVVTMTTLLTFGCTTVRAPVSAIDATVPVHGGTAEPQVELWLESAAAPTPAESARAVADAREALRQALHGRTLGDDDVLVVRAQAVSRTQSHRNEQHAAIAGSWSAPSRSWCSRWWCRAGTAAALRCAWRAGTRRRPRAASDRARSRT
jgi:hypothetical protein